MAASGLAGGAGGAAAGGGAGAAAAGAGGGAAADGGGCCTTKEGFATSGLGFWMLWLELVGGARPEALAADGAGT